MFGIGHQIRWQGEELHAELEAEPGFDWPGVGVAVLLLLVAFASGAWATSSHVHEWTVVAETYQRHGAWPATFDSDARRCGRQRVEHAHDLTSTCERRLDALTKTNRKFYWDRARQIHVHVDLGVPGTDADGDFVSNEPIAPMRREFLGFQLNPLQVLLGIGALGLLVYRRRAQTNPVRVRIRPGRWVVDGVTFDRVREIAWNRNQLVLTLDGGRTWRTRRIKPIEPAVLALLRTATTPDSLLEEESEARAQLAEARVRGHR